MSCSWTLSRFGTTKSLNPVTTRALQVGHGQPITGKSNSRKKAQADPYTFDYVLGFSLYLLICSLPGRIHVSSQYL